ncbi:hypothetical protein [Clostridium sp. Marseille-P299]|uniref:hypothetical protein n=1 Tax=Clostridium sp. Marseille-P299 TaxID=1805477 RepID=UPI00083490B2|nr:hypothetical protein [Clostridium sp. Marseille-P299]
MKISKKVMALLLVLVMMVSLVACKDKSNETSKNESPTTEATKGAEPTKETAEPTTEPTTEPTETAEPTPELPDSVVTGDISRDDAFYVYCWNGDVKNNILKFFEKYYPEDAARIVYVDTGGSNFYQQKIDPILADPTNPQYPDLFAVEADYLLKYTNSEDTLDVATLGFTEADMANMYPYTVQAATADGKVKALSWQATPGAMMYRRSLAKKYLGTDDPAEVQKYFSDWDTMLQSGKDILEKSGGATKLFSGVDDVKRVYQASRHNAWYDENDTIVVEDTMLSYMDYAKALYDNNLTNNTSQWSTDWAANVTNDNTFAYMGCTWFLHWTLKANSGGTVPGEGTYGDWAMTAGPQEYYWGGTWLAASKGCSDTDLAAKIMRAATVDTKMMKEMCVETLDYVNNKQAIAELIAAGEGNFDFLAGQNFLEYFSPLADAIELPAMSAEDFYITQKFDDQVTEFVNGNKTKDEALEEFKKNVIDAYPYLSK